MILNRSIIGGGRAFLRLLLVLGLVPLVVFSNPGQAAAATSYYGDPAESTLVANGSAVGSKGGTSVGCNFVGYWHALGTTTTIKGSVACSTGWNVSTAKITDLTAKGIGGCASSTSLGDELDGASGSHTFLIPMTDAGCQVTEACMTVTYRTHTMPWWEDSSVSEQVCSGWPVGGPEESEYVEYECLHGQAAQPTVSAPFKERVSTYSDQWFRNVTFNLPATANTSIGWYAYVISAPYHGSSGQYVVSPVIGETSRLISAMAPGTKTLTVKVAAGGSFAYTATTQPYTRIVGAGYVYGQSPNDSTAHWGTYPSLNGGNGLLGITRKFDACAFYFGEKVAEVNNTDEDEPAAALGQVGAPPVEAGPPNGTETEPTAPAPDTPTGGDPCTFDFTDPSTWASAGICQLVSMLAGILDVIAGIPAAILDGLAGLFVPDPDVLASEVDGLQAAWEDSTVGNYAGALGDLDVPTASGGCAGPTVEFSVKSRDVSWEPLNACSGAMANLAGIAKLLITVALGLFGGIALVRVIGKGFGWSPGLGGVE